jgi:pyruvate dehydrogenase E2 component (dihydrolipoyllysine-residue acetyltransferase)
MIQHIVIPKLGQTMEEATVETWHKKEGDTIERGDVVLEVTTDKATLEVEAFISGTLLKVLAPEGVDLPVNTVIALVGEPGEALPDNLAELEAIARGEVEGEAQAKPDVTAEEVAPAAPTTTESTPATPPAPVTAPVGRTLISPRAKKLAGKKNVPAVVLKGTGPNGRIVEADVQSYLDKRNALKVTPAAKVVAAERGVDVLTITGTGPSGRITREDVEKAPVAVIAAMPAAGRVELSAMRRVVAERMTQSKQEAPHFYLFMDIDMTEAAALRKKINTEGPGRIGFHDLLIRACAVAMTEHPAMNTAWDNGAILQKGEINIGLAVAIDEGLMVPVVKSVDTLSIQAIAQKSKELIEKARTKKLTPDEYDCGSLTISNLGMFDVDSFLPVINPGESAIIGVGKIGDKVVARDGGIHIRSMMTASLSADHRSVDGAIAAAYLKCVKDLLEAPDGLL